MHLSLVHDTWHSGGIRVGWMDFGFVLDDSIQTIADFIAKKIIFKLKSEWKQKCFARTSFFCCI